DWNYNYKAIDSETTLIAAPAAGTLLYYTPYDPTLSRQQIRSQFSYYRSTDLGTTWEGNSNFAGRVLSVAAIADAVWLGMSNGDTLTLSHPASVLAMSYDGMHWNLDSTSGRGLNIRSIFFNDSAHGWAIGNDSHIAYNDSTVAYLLKYAGAPLLGVRTQAVTTRPSVELSPNPATSVIHFRMDGTENVLGARAIDMLGIARECPLRFSGGGVGDADISALPPGAYLLQFRTAMGSVFSRIIKLP
ncbi:MAG TPA: T9SS type A sorting domain-containing protein, partial [Candidatus Kapabacteria bacterium]|nr:T9SS type A sorting domain-containing protein [Candidatus Kapabacteria bacterium]